MIKRNIQNLINRFESLKKANKQKLHEATVICSYWIYNFPYHFIVASLSITLIFGLGILRGQDNFANGADVLYSLQNSLAREHGHIHSTIFSESRARRTHMIITSADPGRRNILNREIIEIAKKLDDLIKGKIVDEISSFRVAVPLQKCRELHKANNNKSPQKDCSDRPILYDRLCLKHPNKACIDNQILDTLNAELQNSPSNSIESLLMIDDLIFNTRNRDLIPAHGVLGGIRSRPCLRPFSSSLIHELETRKFSSTFFNKTKMIVDQARSQIQFECIYHAEAILLTYALHENEENHRMNDSWEAMLIQVLKRTRIWGPAHITFSAFRSRDDELRSSTSDSEDLLLVFFTFLSIIIYCAMVNFSCNLYRTKTIPAIMGVVASALALVAGIGFCCLMGLALVPTASICPFLVIGIGVDDTFVILNSYTLSISLAHRPEERCRACLSTSGISITLTTLTSLVSFIVGSWSPYLSIKNFCLFCGASLLFGYIFCFSFFYAFICIDAYHEAKQEILFGLCCPQEKYQSTAESNSPIFTLPQEEEAYVYCVAHFLRRLLQRVRV